MRCVVIGVNGWWDVVDISKEDMAKTIGAEYIGHAAVGFNARLKERSRYGCAYDEDGCMKDGTCTVMLRKPRLLFPNRRHARFFKYIYGPVIIYKNGGLSQRDVEWVTAHIMPYHEDPLLVVDKAIEKDDYGEEEP